MTLSFNPSKAFLFALVIGSAGSALAKMPEYSFSQEVKLYFSERQLNQNIDPISSTTDMILLANSNVIAELDFLRVELKPEVRALAGNSNQLSYTSPSAIHLESPERAIDARWHLGSPAQNAILYGDWERLSVAYHQDATEVYVGRKIVSLGVLKYFPVWNKFSRPLPGVTLIPIYFGSDGFGARTQIGNWALSANQLIYNKGRDQISIGEVTSYNSFAEIHAMIGQWWNQTVFGMAFSKDIMEATINGEFLNYGTNSQLGLGFERALSSKLTLSLEMFYQSEGASNSLDYNPLLSSHFRNLQANLYSWAVLQCQIHPLWKAQAGGLTNWVDQGTALNLGVTHSLSDHFDLVLEGLLSLARQYSEFSTQSFEFSDGTKFGLPTQVVAHLDWSF